MSDNGILSRIPGEHIARALQSLPPANSASPESAETEIDVPIVGRVLFTAERIKTKKGKSVHYFWSATKAELI